MFNAALFRVAREALGFTQPELAAITGFDQADLSRWERGLREPSSEHIPTLADAVGIAPRLLSKEIPVTTPVHRSVRMESKRIQRRANGRLELARIAAHSVLEDIDIETPFKFPTISEPGPPDPEQAAESVRRVWRIPDGPLFQLTSYLEAAGATVIKVDFATDAIDSAYSQLASNSRWFFLNTKVPDPARNRFSLAHELGHAVLHWDRFDAPIAAEAEREAHHFAAALLMPRQDIVADLAASSMSVPELIQIGERWGVSPQALVIRAAALDLISIHTRKRIFQKLNVRGMLRVGLASIPPEKPQLLATALHLQRVENAYTDEELAILIGLSLAQLRDLLPDYFTSFEAPRARLRVVGANTQC